MRFTDYDRYDGLGLAKLVADGEVTAAELVEEAIQRIEECNPSLNAVVYKMYEQAREAATGDLPAGAFRGVPFLLKDLMAAYAGVPLSSGSRLLKDYVPTHDSELVKRFKAAGVIVVGKTNTPEFGIPPYTEPEVFGAAHNPYDLARTPGGSSGGSAAAVAARIVPLASGGDGGGSIRIPASCCGLVGLKPTRGRNPMGPHIGESFHGFVCENVLTRSVRDSAAMLDATAGADSGAPYSPSKPERTYLQEVTTEPGKLRIAFTVHPFFSKRPPDADCVEGLNATVKLLEGLGHTVIEEAPKIDQEAAALAFLKMFMGEIGATLNDIGTVIGRKVKYREVEIETWALSLLGHSISAADYMSALHFLQTTSRQVGHFFEHYDVLLTPTLGMPPVLIGSLQAKPIEKLLLNVVSALNAGWLLSSLNIAAQLPSTPLTLHPIRRCST